MYVKRRPISIPCNQIIILQALSFQVHREVATRLDILAIPVRVITQRSIAIGYLDLWIDVVVQTKNRHPITCVLCSPHVMRVCVKAHTASVKNMLLLGKSWLHSQDKVGGL